VLIIIILVKITFGLRILFYVSGYLISEFKTGKLTGSLGNFKLENIKYISKYCIILIKRLHLISNIHIYNILY